MALQINDAGNLWFVVFQEFLTATHGILTVKPRIFTIAQMRQCMVWNSTNQSNIMQTYQ